jgi:hypothetical protein
MATARDMVSQMLLLWLARKDRGLPRGKCNELALSKLMADGLVKERPARVCLTAMGWSEVARIQERMRASEPEE